MGQDRNIAGRLQPKDEVLQSRWQQMVRRLKQQVPGIVESEGPTVAQLDVKIGGDMHVCAGDEADGMPASEMLSRSRATAARIAGPVLL